MDKVGIVVLNYLNYSDTLECLNSIKTQNYENYEVIIVENGSKNESNEILNNYIQGLDNFHLVTSDINLGFAKGNNLGIDYARNNLNCSFVLLVNNDTIFTDVNLLLELIKNYQDGVGVIGPRIILRDNAEQNPVYIPNTKKQVIISYILNFLVVYHLEFIANLAIYIKRSLKKDKEVYSIERFNQEGYDLILNGACMLLTPDYFKYFDKLFPNTFLYCEENILTLITSKVKLKKKFVSTAYIYHKEDQSSKMSFFNNNRIMARYSLESLNYCYRLFNMDYNQILDRYFNS